MMLDPLAVFLTAAAAAAAAAIGFYSGVVHAIAEYFGWAAPPPAEKENDR